MRVELAADGWVEHEPAWMAPDESRVVLAALLAELSWERREVVLFGRRVWQPRLVAWAGDLPYRYSGQTLEPRPFTPTLDGILRRVRDRAAAPFNHMLANRYRDGQDSMGLHADDEPELGVDPVVATLSFGATRRFVLKPRNKSKAPPLAFDLTDGGLLVMGGTCQRHYVHGVPRQPAVRAERVSLTFRCVTATAGRGTLRECQSVLSSGP